MVCDQFLIVSRPSFTFITLKPSASFTFLMIIRGINTNGKAGYRHFGRVAAQNCQQGCFLVCHPGHAGQYQ
jgi:hypothetical protein